MGSASRETSSGRDDLRTAYTERVEAELAAADRELPGAESVSWAGDLLADVVLLKGEPGPAETGGGIALSGPDGDAARKALDTLGYDPDRVFFTLTRPLPGVDPSAVASRVRRIIEAVDPAWVVCADPVAGDDVGRAFDAPKPARAMETALAGRRVLVLSGLEASLADQELKRTVWAELKAMEVTDGRKL